MSPLPLFSLRTRYPCCGQRAFIEVIHELPRAKFVRRCRRCKTTWDVDMERLAVKPGVRIDKLTWIDTAGRAYRQEFGT